MSGDFRVARLKAQLVSGPKVILEVKPLGYEKLVCVFDLTGHRSQLSDVVELVMSLTGHDNFADGNGTWVRVYKDDTESFHLAKIFRGNITLWDRKLFKWQLLNG